jgi:hypothetical protein
MYTGIGECILEKEARAGGSDNEQWAKLIQEVASEKNPLTIPPIQCDDSNHSCSMFAAD